MAQNELHRRWTTVLDAGELKDWVGVSDATLADFRRGVVHGRRVTVDAHCVADCPGCAARPRPLGW